MWYKDLKYVFNGFDYDELYDLSSDVEEMNNLINDKNYIKQKELMMKLYWKEIEMNGDHSIYNLDNNPILKILDFGPKN